MSEELTDEADPTPLKARKKPRWKSILCSVEDHLVATTLATLLVITLLSILLRAFFHTGISGSNSFIRHLTLIVCMLGGAIAARENRLLSLSTLSDLMKGRVKSFSLIFCNSFAATINVFLCAASIQFLLSEKLGGKSLAYGIPIWIIQLILPLGFGLITLRLILHASKSLKGRISALLLSGLLIGIVTWSPVMPEKMVIPSLILLFVAAILGSPVFTTVGGAALIFLWGEQIPAASISLKHYSLVTNQSLPTIPLFTLAGLFLAEGGASKRLINVFQALFSKIHGGPAVVTVLLCAFFTSFTGASGVTILALGGLLLPVLLVAGYSEKNGIGLLTGAGSLGLLFPPCLPLILYAIVAGSIAASQDISHSAIENVTIGQMFLGGVGPGILLVILTVWWGIRRGPKSDVVMQSFEWDKVFHTIWEAKWELLLPVVALVVFFSGYVPPVESAAVTAFYAFFIETFVYRDLKLIKDVPRVITECGIIVGGVLLILGVAMGLTYYLILAEIPSRAVEWVTSNIESRWVFLLTLNCFLLIVGCLMDIYSAIVIVVPLIIPMGMAYGIHPVHLGVIFLANLELGYLTPPIGMNLFLSSYRFHKPLPEIYRSVAPLLFVLLIGVILITYVPALTITLPNMFK